MKIPKNIDLSELNVKKIFEPSTKEYKKFMSMNDEGEWKEYVNEMLARGVSVIYDASGDFFIAKPVAFKENNNRMRSTNKKKLGLKDFSFLNEGALDMDNMSDSSFKDDDLLTEDGESYPWDECIKDQKKQYGSKKTAEKVCGSIKARNENKNNKNKKSLKELENNKYLLYDDNEDEDVEELPGNDMDVETSVDDLAGMDDNEDNMDTGIEVVPETPADPKALLSVQDIENIVKQFLSGQNSTEQQESGVPDILANGEGSIINQSDETEIDMLDSEFQEIQSKLDIVENKIENDESYLDILNGDSGSNNQQKGESFEIYEEPPVNTPGIIEEDDYLDSISANNYEDGDLDMEPEIEEPIAQNGSTIQASGSPVKIQITGWLITIPQVDSLAESIKKSGCKLIKLESSSDKELNLIIESNKKFYKIKYEDKSKAQTSRPWSIKDKKFASLKEAALAISKRTMVSDKESNFRNLIGNDKDLSSRKLSNLQESDIFEDFRNDKNTMNYVAGWNIKNVGSLDLKSGINETYSNITQHSSKDKNTLFKTKEGKYYLLKGNLGESAGKGTKRQLVDLEGRKEYGIGQVIGLYENSHKGLGQIMYKIKRTSIPLLVWKRK